MIPLRMQEITSFKVLTLHPLFGGPTRLSKGTILTFLLKKKVALAFHLGTQHSIYSGNRVHVSKNYLSLLFKFF